MMAKSLVRPTSKGQVTIPRDIRKKLGIDNETFLDVSLEGGKIVLQAVTIGTDNVRIYTDEEITQFLKDDVLSPENAAFVNQTLKTNRY